jgi:hypothetical protein
MSMKQQSVDIIGNQSRDLPACSAGPQPTAPPRTPELYLYNNEFRGKRRHWQLKEEALEFTLWRTRFAIVHRPVLRQTGQWMTSTLPKRLHSLQMNNFTFSASLNVNIRFHSAAGNRKAIRLCEERTQSSSNSLFSKTLSFQGSIPRNTNAI